MRDFVRVARTAEWVAFVLGAMATAVFQFVAISELVYISLVLYCSGFVILCVREILLLKQFKSVALEDYLAQFDENKSAEETLQLAENQDNSSEEPLIETTDLAEENITEKGTQDEQKVAEFKSYLKLSKFWCWIRFAFGAVLAVFAFVILVLYK